MNENLCVDNRFELIEKYKQKLIEATNIETSPEEMAVIDNILFRFWQMGWLDKLNRRGGQFYSERISNDDHKAVEILDQFTKAFCIDASVTDDLQFRCKDCEFEIIDGTCLVKKMAKKLCPDYKDFGSMGDL